MAKCNRGRIQRYNWAVKSGGKWVVRDEYGAVLVILNNKEDYWEWVGLEEYYYREQM